MYRVIWTEGILVMPHSVDHATLRSALLHADSLTTRCGSPHDRIAVYDIDVSGVGPDEVGLVMSLAWCDGCWVPSNCARMPRARRAASPQE